MQNGFFPFAQCFEDGFFSFVPFKSILRARTLYRKQIPGQTSCYPRQSEWLFRDRSRFESSTEHSLCRRAPNSDQFSSSLIQEDRSSLRTRISPHSLRLRRKWTLFTFNSQVRRQSLKRKGDSWHFRFSANQKNDNWNKSFEQNFVKLIKIVNGVWI